MLIVLLVIFVLTSIGLGIFVFMVSAERDDYKNNSDKKVAAAVEVARQQVSDEKEKEFLEREKNPYKEYKGPSAFGSVSIIYPRTWAAAIDETGKGTSPVDGLMHPNFVPSVNSGTAYALKIEVLERNYAEVLGQFESESKKGTVRVSPFKAAKVPEVLGARVDGEIGRGLDGSMVVFPLRDKTISVSTQSQQFIGDFNNIILPNLLFIP